MIKLFASETSKVNLLLLASDPIPRIGVLFSVFTLEPGGAETFVQLEDCSIINLRRNGVPL